MNKNKVIGTLLLLLALAVIAGLVIDEAYYWFPLDYVTIAVCGISGGILLRGKL